MTDAHSSPRGTTREQRPGGGSAASQKAQREKVQKQLDEALAATFPASDPVSIVTSHEEEDWGGSEPLPPGKE